LKQTHCDAAAVVEVLGVVAGWGNGEVLETDHSKNALHESSDWLWSFERSESHFERELEA
jgi:hypothetical protein